MVLEHHFDPPPPRRFTMLRDVPACGTIRDENR
jgi:hypothetical protein